jgi:hypothetical protein
MSNNLEFPDGAAIEWVDKETLRYREGNRAVLIWVDFERGLFSGGRIVRASSIGHWDGADGPNAEPVDAKTREQIVEKIQAYYGHHRVKCRVER